MNNTFEKKYKIVQNIYDRMKYREHHYPPSDNSFVGRWTKYGHKVVVNNSTDSLMCDDCFEDYFRRKKNRDGVIKESSYQVTGFTHPNDLWEWEFGVCRNQTRCWGQYDRIFDVKRKGYQYQLTCSKVKDGINEEIQNRMYFTLVQNHRSPMLLTSMSSKYGHSPFFWPGLFEGEPQDAWYIISINTGSNKPLPLPWMKNSPIAYWPSEFQTPDYIYPNQMWFYTHRFDKKKPWPETVGEMEQNHIPVGLTYLQMYPGGSGFICRQYKWVRNQEFDDSVKVEDGDFHNDIYVLPYESFIPFVQDGYAGKACHYYVTFSIKNNFCQFLFLIVKR